MTQERLKYAIFVDGSEDCERAQLLLRERGLRLQVVDTREIPVSSDRPLILPCLLAPQGEFRGLKEIQEFLKLKNLLN